MDNFKPLVGFVDSRNLESYFMFEINMGLTEEQVEHLKELQKEFQNCLSDQMNNSLNEYKNTVKNFLLKQNLIVKEIDLPVELLIHFGESDAFQITAYTVNATDEE